MFGKKDSRRINMKSFRVFSGDIAPDDDLAGNIAPRPYRAGDIAPFAVVAMCLVAMALGGWFAVAQTEPRGLPGSFDVPTAPPWPN
jgi:hypothetical protein